MPRGGYRPGAGRKPRGGGAAPKITAATHAAKSDAAGRLQSGALADKALDLPEEEVVGITPRRAFQLILEHAMRTRNLALAIEVARHAAPYEHARAEANPLTPEALQHAIELARLEAARRGIDLSAGTGVNQSAGERVRPN